MRSPFDQRGLAATGGYPGPLFAGRSGLRHERADAHHPAAGRALVGRLPPSGLLHHSDRDSY